MICDPEKLRASRRNRMRRWRDKMRGAGARPGVPLLPFVGVDGEGGGTDELGRQNYLLLRAGEVELFHDNERLSSRDCLEFITALDRNAIHVGYFFGYDATQIFRDLPPARLERIFTRSKDQKSRYVYWDQFAIDYVPRQYLSVGLRHKREFKVIPGSVRTINECGTFFQQAFVKAIQDWNIGDPETVAMIARNKDRRQEFDKITQEERDYCAAECRLLAELMTEFRNVCIEADIVPRYWRGAGHLATKLHAEHKTPKRKDRQRDPAIDLAGNYAYYGGRFEITKVGPTEGPIYEYDINSAYPAAMLRLPCPIHSEIRYSKSSARFGPDFLAAVGFSHDRNQWLCGLPIRNKDGRLYWPRQGRGVYWSHEIRAAERNGADVTIRHGWEIVKTCDCRPFDWVRDLYEYRKSIGKAKKGYPIKLGLNGLYGKLAQSIGAAPYADLLLAGYITAEARAMLMRAYQDHQHDILMLATDALYSVKPLLLDLGAGLGQWEETVRPDIFIVQPGLYWSSSHQPKTRGVARSVIIEHRARFERVFHAWRHGGAGEAPPGIDVPVHSFIGTKLALAWNRPEAAGCWLDVSRHINFDWGAKRSADMPSGLEFGWCEPLPGSPATKSIPYDRALLTDLAFRELLDEAAPDFVPWGNSGE